MSTISLLRRRFLRGVALPLALGLAQIAPAYATVDNTVTVTATTPSGSTITPNASENVDVEDDAPALTIVKAHTLTKGSGTNVNGEAGDTVNYTYTVTNTGNTTLTAVSIADVHDISGGTTNLTVAEPTTYTDNQPDGASAGQSGDSSDGTPADGTWDTLGPGDVIVFTASYSIVQADLNANGGGAGPTDGDIDNTATVSASYNDGAGAVTFNANSSDAVPLYVNPSLTVAKVATFDLGAGTVTADGTNDNVPPGTVLTYTYTVTNNGNVDMTAITLADTHKGVLNALTPAFSAFSPGGLGSSNTGNTIDVLKPGDSAVFTATYTVLQDDVDNLQ